jgi:hypothetical protein
MVDEDAAKFASSVTGTANNSNFNHIVFLIKMFRYVMQSYKKTDADISASVFYSTDFTN